MSMTNARTSLGMMAKRRTDLDPDEAERVRAVVRRLCGASPSGQSELARSIGMKPSAINQIVSGKNSPSLATAKAIAAHMGVPWQELLTGGEEDRHLPQRHPFVGPEPPQQVVRRALQFLRIHAPTLQKTA